MVHGSIHGFLNGLVYGWVHRLVYVTWYMVPLGPFKTVLYNVLLDHGGLPCVLPFAVHLDLGHLPDTQGYLGLLSDHVLAPRPSKI